MISAKSVYMEGMGWEGKTPVNHNTIHTYTPPPPYPLYIIYICFNYWLNLRPGVHFATNVSA